MRRMRPLIILLLCALLLSGCGAAAPEPTPTPEPSPEPTPCPHPSWNNGVCTECGYVCTHPVWADGACTTCGRICTHPSWIDGYCAVCGRPCAHPAWADGACVVCGTRCVHPGWANGACTVCGILCQHPGWQDGVCTVCGSVCLHPVWQDGVCTTCGAVCEHSTHTLDSHCCSTCGVLVYHSYRAGRCAVCGATPQFSAGALPERFYTESTQRGSISSLNYTATEIDGKEYTRHALVYLPYGYDGSTRCNLLILLHGAGDDERGWLTLPHPMAGRSVEIRTIFDRMIEEKLIEPVIIVSLGLDGDFGSYTGGASNEGLAREIREILLPYLAENYATYAASGSPEDLSAARQHIAIGGLSMGASYAYAAGMRMNMDLIGSFVCLSGIEPSGTVLEALNSAGQAGYPIYLYYAAAGSTDMALYNVTNSYRAVVDGCARLVEGANAFYHECEGAHEWSVWATEMYNALQLCFQD